MIAPWWPPVTADRGSCWRRGPPNRLSPNLFPWRSRTPTHDRAGERAAGRGRRPDHRGRAAAGDGFSGTWGGRGVGLLGVAAFQLGSKTYGAFWAYRAVAARGRDGGARWLGQPNPS